jgi:hypothetical protein
MTIHDENKMADDESLFFAPSLMSPIIPFLILRAMMYLRTHGPSFIFRSRKH